MKTDTISVRVDPELKTSAKAVLDKLGMSMAQAVNMFLRQVKLQKGLPFEAKIPNEETVNAMEEVLAKNKTLKKCSMEELKKMWDDA